MPTIADSPITMAHGLSIREMLKEDLIFAAQCTAAEGWVSEGLSTLEAFYLHDPGGCLLAEEYGQPVGICIATCYGKSGFIGELIVVPHARGKGIGAALLNHAAQKMRKAGALSIYLDGVTKAVGLYERNGFHKVCRSWRFTGRGQVKRSPSVRRMEEDDLALVFALDKASFGADRSFFLRNRLQQFPQLCHVMIEGGELTGFIQGRSGAGWASAGPWVVSEGAENPSALLQAFALETGDTPISIGILDANQQACNIVRLLGFVERNDSPWRMALSKRDDLGTSPNCYAVGSAAKG